jgi:hypothetical protein
MGKISKLRIYKLRPEPIKKWGVTEKTIRVDI